MFTNIKGWTYCTHLFKFEEIGQDLRKYCKCLHLDKGVFKYYISIFCTIFIPPPLLCHRRQSQKWRSHQNPSSIRISSVLQKDKNASSLSWHMSLLPSSVPVAVPVKFNWTEIALLSVSSHPPTHPPTPGTLLPVHPGTWNLVCKLILQI